MKLDTMHSQGAVTVAIGLESEQERSYSNEQLARIALSQDRLTWPDTLQPVAYVSKAKLRRLPRDRRFSVLRLGAAAAVVITPV